MCRASKCLSYCTSLALKGSLNQTYLARGRGVWVTLSYTFSLRALYSGVLPCGMWAGWFGVRGLSRAAMCEASTLTPVLCVFPKQLRIKEQFLGLENEFRDKALALHLANLSLIPGTARSGT